MGGHTAAGGGGDELPVEDASALEACCDNFLRWDITLALAFGSFSIAAGNMNLAFLRNSGSRAIVS